MKYFILIALTFLVCFSTVQGATLVADCITGADYYIITGLPSTYDVSHVPPDPTGVYAFRVVITDILTGLYTVVYKACTYLWGCSPDSAPLTFTKPTLEQPGGACKVIP